MKSPFSSWGRRPERSQKNRSCRTAESQRRRGRRRALQVERLEDRELLTVTVGFLTNVGNFQVELYDDQAPQTVQNFLSYVAYGSMNGTIFHRTVPGFIVQGGGFNIDGAIAADPAVQNEFSASRSNVRGTIAMAKLGGNPNSATNQWFFNLANNASNLDNQNGGFTVFGRVINDGMTVVDAIANTPNFDKRNGNGLPAGLASASVAGALQNLPLLNYDNNPTTDPVTGANLVTVNAVTVLSSTNTIAPILQRLTNSSFAAGSTITRTLEAVDFDVQLGRNETLTFSLDAGAPAGASITPQGQFNWTPTPAQYGRTHSITVRVTDSAGKTDSQSVSVAISAPPVLAVNNVLTLDQNATATISSSLLSVTDADTPAVQISYIITQGTTRGTVRKDGQATTTFTQDDINQGRITYASNGQGGNDSFLATVGDGNAVSSITVPFSITVRSLNAAPSVAVNAGLSLAKGTTGSITNTQLSAVDPDNTAAQLLYTVTSAPTHGSLLRNGVAAATFSQDDLNQGRITYVHNGDGAVADSFAFTVTDNIAPPTAAQNFALRINQPPSIAPVGNRSVDELSLLDIALSVADVNGDTLTVSVDAGVPAGATFDPATRRFRWTPTESQGPGSYPITFRVTDNGTPSLFTTESIVITVNNVNSPPVIVPVGNRSVLQGQTVQFTVAASDLDLPAQQVTLSMDQGAPTGATFIPATGEFTWNVPIGQALGDYSVTFRARDDASPAGETTQTVVISVKRENLAPTLAAIGNRTIDEGTPLIFTAVGTDGNTPADVLTYTLLNAPAGAGINPATGAFTWTPTEEQGNTGSFTFTVRVTDNGVPPLFDEETITVTVNKTNMAPVLGTIGLQNVVEGNLLLFTATGFDDDLPDQQLTFSMDSNAPSGATFDPLTRVFRWTPTEAQGPGVYTATIRVTDSQGASDSETFTITVGEADLPPLINEIPLQQVAEGQTLNILVTATDPDLPAQALTFSLVASSTPTGAVITPQGAFSWTPSEAQGPGEFNIQVLVTDSTGLSDTKTLRVRVSEANQAPQLGTLTNRSVNEAALLSFLATATDADLPANVLTFSLDAGAPSGATITPQGQFTWTPSAAQSGQTFPISIRVTDERGLSASQTFQVTVNDVNQPPLLAIIGDQLASELRPISFVVSATDPDLPADTLTFSLDPGAPAGATFDPATRQFQWTPSEDQGGGSYSVTIRVRDGQGGEDSETFQIQVLEANLAPIFIVDTNSYFATEGQPLRINIGAGDDDLPRNQLHLSLLSGAPAGATLAADDSEAILNFDSAESQGGATYTVVVRATDSSGLFTDLALTIQVGETQETPQLAPLAARSVQQGQTLTAVAAATDADLPVQALSYSLVGTVPDGATVDPQTGVVRWDVPSDQNPGEYELTLRVTDPTGLSSDQPLRITVSDAPDLDPLSLLLTARDADAFRNIGGVTLATSPGPVLAGAPGTFPLSGFLPTSAESAAAFDRALAILADATADGALGPDTGVAHVVHLKDKNKAGKKAQDDSQPTERKKAPKPNDEESSQRENRSSLQSAAPPTDSDSHASAVNEADTEAVDASAATQADEPLAAADERVALLLEASAKGLPVMVDELAEAVLQRAASDSRNITGSDAASPTPQVSAGLPLLIVGAAVRPAKRPTAPRTGRLGQHLRRPPQQ